MDLELLRTFAAVADAPSLTAAAAQLRVTKSAVSQQLKTLEARMGMPLFERSGRGIKPTPAAEALAAVLRESFARADAAVEATREAHGAVRGPVTIGAPRPFTQANLSATFARLLASHPELVLDVAFGTPTELEAALIAGTLDLAVLSRPPETPNLETAPLFVETFTLVASPRYLEAYGEPQTADDFDVHRLIVFDRDEPMHRAWWRATFGGRTAARGRVTARVASLDTMLSLVIAGSGLAVLPDYFVAPARAARKVVALRVRGAKRVAQNTIVLAWRRSIVTTARLLAVRAAILEDARSG